MSSEQLNTPETLREAWHTFRENNPKVRIRDAARQLGTSEAGLVATGLGSTATLLRADFEAILKETESLGHVMALTRNDHVVHERKGVYEKVSFKNHIGLVLGPDIDLRLFMSHWYFGFAVEENGRKSLQFFGIDGEAVHKIYLTEKSNHEAFDALVVKYSAADQTLISTSAYLPEKEDPTDFRKEDFQADWLAMTDTHQFFGMLRKHKLARIDAVKNAPAGHAYAFNKGQVLDLLQDIAKTGLPFMVFVASRGCTQIHTGPIHKIFVAGPWINIMDPEFNLHLRIDQVAEAWVVLKPTSEGIVTSIELYDNDGQMVVQFFGKRKPGIPEMTEWQEIVRNHTLGAMAV